MSKRTSICSYYTVNHSENEDENKSHNNRYNINRHILDEDTKIYSKYKVS